MVTRAKADYEFRAQDKTGGAFRSFRRSINDTSVTMEKFRGTIGTLVGIAGVGGFAALLKSSANAADEIGKVATVVGLTTRELQAYRLEANKANVSTAAFDSAMTAFAKRVGELSEAGKGPLMSFLKEYDIELARNIARTRTQGEALRLLSDRVKAATTATERAAIVNAAFGRSNIDLVNALSGGSDALDEAIDRAERYGQILSEEAIVKSASFNDRLAELSKTLETQLLQAVLDNSDAIIQMTESITKAIPKVLEFFGATSRPNRLNEINTELIELQETLETYETGTAFEKIVRGFGIFDALDEASIKSVKDQIAALIEERNKLLMPPPAAGGGPGGGPAELPRALREEEGEENMLAKLEEQTRQRFELVNRGLLTEEERLKTSFLNRSLIIEDAYVSGIIPTEQRYQEIRTANEAQFQQKLSEIEARGLTERQQFERKSLQQKAKTVFGELQAITAGVSQQNKTLFRINQVAAIANATVNAFEGASNTLGSYPWPLAQVLAGLHLAAGFAQVAAIRGATFSGGGAAPSLAGGGAVSAPVPTIESGIAIPGQDQGQAREVNIVLQGTGFSKQDVRNLIEQINEEVGDGVRVSAA